MNIVSYRGPGKAGGLSSTLTKMWQKHGESDSSWWYLDNLSLEVTSGARAHKLAALSKELVEGHYRYCNEFLWPIMHDLSDYAIYKPDDRKLYKQFNKEFSVAVMQAPESLLSHAYFVQDYQLAALPSLLKDNKENKSVVFWHIPWPKKVDERYILPIADLAQGLLRAEAIGFHTQEYADNFVAFAQKHVTAFHGDLHKKVIVAPLGVDFDYWANLAEKQEKEIWYPFLTRTPFILSVDRADFTKGVSNRMQAIEQFFRSYPEWREKISFLQVCGRTRTGVEVFDKYWDECKQLADCLISEFQTDNWQPIIWLERGLNSAELALLYRAAAGMLVNPLRDGLNLTAKEYVACQNGNPGMLGLSAGAGAYFELGDCCVPVDPRQVEVMADSIHSMLIMTQTEKNLRMDVLKAKVRSNDLESWWKLFSDLLTDSSKEKSGAKVVYRKRLLSYSGSRIR